MMLRSFLLAGSAAALLSLPAAAKPNGWYVGIAGGANWVEDTQTFRAVGAGAFAPYAIAEFDTGWAALANVGYRWPSNWRLELEGGYRSNDGNYTAIPFGSCTATPGAGATCASLELTEWTLMGNVYYDFPLSARWTLSVGAGIGADFIDFDQNILSPQWDEDTVLAGQLIAQLAFAVTPQVEVYLDYHYLTLDTPEFTRSNGNINERLEMEVDKHAALIGLRYDLYPDEVAAPPPPPPPAPPPPPQVKQFVVFFGFNKYNLTADAQSVVAEAAAQAKAQGAASIVVVGHTDTSGSAGYNQKLSEKRAKAVADELVRMGIAPGMISASGRGENELLVQTGDGVKEPQNRRATIDLR